MKKFNVTILLFILLIVLAGLSFFMLNRIDNQAIEKDLVYVVVKTTSENKDFWNSIVKGARVAATELGARVEVVGPPKEIHIERQIEIVRDLIKGRPKAIAIAASEYYLLGPVCDEAAAAGVTLVTYDSDAAMATDHSFVATNNFEAAQRIGHELGTLMDKGKVAVVAHVEGAFTSFERVEGFKQGLKPFDRIEVMDRVFYSDNNLENAYNYAKDLLREDPEIRAIFGTNELCLTGVGLAVKDLGMEDQVTVVGFDMSPEIALMIEEGYIAATMVQRPFNMGYIAVREALEVLEGKEVEVVDTGAVLINKENMFLPENQKLIVPGSQ